MKSDFLEFIGNARQRRSEKFRNQLSTFLICLLLSVFIWALVRLSKDYYYTVDYRLNYTQVPGNLSLTACSDTALRLRIKIQGFEFFWEKLGILQGQSQDVSLRNVRLRWFNDRLTGYMLTGPIGKEIISQTNFPSDVYLVMPDTLFFEFERSTIKRMPSRSQTEAVRINIGGKDTLIKHLDTMIRHESGKPSIQTRSLQR